MRFLSAHRKSKLLRGALFGYITGVGVIDARLWRWPFLWEWVGDVPQWRSVSQWHKNYVFVSSQWLLVCRMSLNRRRLQCHSAPFSIIQHFPGHSAERRAPAASTSMCGGAFLSTKTSKTATALVADHASASPGIITATSWDHSDIYSDYIICFFECQWVCYGLFTEVCGHLAIFLRRVFRMF